MALLLSSPAIADNMGLQLPNMGSSYGQDSIRAGDLDCKNSIGGSTNLEFGITGIIDNYNSPFRGGSDIDTSRDIGVYARIIIPLDGPKERINCNDLYELELRKKRLEVLKLQQELEQLRRLSEGNPVEFEPEPTARPTQQTVIIPNVESEGQTDTGTEQAPRKSIRPVARPDDLKTN